MESPSLSSAASSSSSGFIKRSPFVPVKRSLHGQGQVAAAATPRQEFNQVDDDGRVSTRPALVPLTSSNLSRFSAAISSQEVEQVQDENSGMPVMKHTNSTLKGYTSVRTATAATATAAPASPAVSSSSTMLSSSNNNNNNHHKSLGYGLPSRHAVAAPAPSSSINNNKQTTTLLSSKRYTRQMAPIPGDNHDNMISASDLRARARLTSGSAPRKKPAVPGAERADHVMPSMSSSSSSVSRARARSITAATGSGAASASASTIHAASISRPISSCSVRTPSRPPSRTGEYPSSISRPQSRIGNVPSDLIISAAGGSADYDNAVPSHSRRDSTSSVGTVIQRKQENVLVCVRVRPPAVKHTELNVNPAHLEEAWMTTPDNGSIALADGSGHQYRFDALVTGSGNESVYAVAASDLIKSAMNGYDAVIFAYGQTASGKTFTLSGTQSNPGIIPQAVSDIFKYIRAHPKKEFLLRASYLEIYNEQLKDLLAPETAGQVKIRQDERKRFFVSPLREEVVTTEAHVSQLLLRGESNRHTGSTDYNARSSRSHAVFQIVIESRDIHNGPSGTPVARGLRKGGLPSDDRAVVTSRLSLIDLAGSEKATSQADRRVEGAFINKSLLTLEKVIAALTEERSRAHVPYRDSKLTQILQPSLSGEARVAVICTVNPSPVAIQESTSTLKFAQRVKKVTLNAERNEIVGEKALIIRYEQTIAEMTAYIAQLECSQTPQTNSASSEEDQARSHQQSNRNFSNPDVLKAKEDRAKLQGFIVTAGNLDEQRTEGPRPVTPLRAVSAAQLPLLQEQLLDSQDRVAELEELSEKQQDEIASLKAQLTARTAEVSGSSGPDAAFQALQARNAELERQCREYRTILANEDQVTALRSERRLAAREWSDKLVQLQQGLDKSRAMHSQAVQQLFEEQQKNRRLEKTLLKSGIHGDAIKSIDSSPDHSISTSMIGLDLLSSESPMLDIQGSYLNLDEILESPLSTPVRSRR